MVLPKIEEYPRVGDFMDERRVALEPDQDIVEAVHYLLSHRITGAPVVDEERRPLGVLGERDCLRILTEGDKGHPPRGKVRDFMRTKFQTVTPDMDVHYAAGLFLNERNWSDRRFLVVEDGKLVGVLTRYDALRAVETVHTRRRELER